MTRLFPAIIAIVMVACATPQEKAAKTVTKYGPYCEALGYAKGSDAWRDCLLKEQARTTQAIMAD